MDSNKIEASLRVKNMMRLFLMSVMDYEGESGEAICKDEREPLEFVEIFLDSEDAFDYLELMKLIKDA